MWIKAPNMKSTHGFSTRHGGISAAPFNTLNLGSSQDSPSNITTNRERALQDLQLNTSQLCTLKQVHGTRVCQAKPGSQEGDALVTDDPNMVLAVSVADCYPILFYDSTKQIVAAAHAGWRGTVGKIAGRVVEEMMKLGSSPQNIQVAIGQGISQKHFEVGEEVVEQFETAGFPEQILGHGTSSRRTINLAAANKWIVAQQGIPEENVWSMNRCTFEEDFFSYRRDQGITGRMWGLITLRK